MISNNLYVIAAIAGNFYQESQVNPGAWQNWTIGDPGYGLGQWTDNPPQVMRRTALFNWLSANGYPQDSGAGQLAFLVNENVWIPSLITPSSYNTLSDFFASTSTNMPDLVAEFMYHWEGINDSSFNTRLNAANLFLGDFQNDTGARVPWHSANAMLTLTESRENAMHVLDFFLGSTPPGPTPQPIPDDLITILNLARKKNMKGGIFITW